MMKPIKVVFLCFCLTLIVMVTESDESIAIYFHHKTGSSSLIHILPQICIRLNYKVCRSNGADDNCCYIFQHAFPSQLLANTRGVHVVRDPRNMLVSGYFSHKISHPMADWLKPLRSLLRKLPKEQGLLLEMRYAFGSSGREARSPHYAAGMCTFPQRSYIHTVRFETLLSKNWTVMIETWRQLFNLLHWKWQLHEQWMMHLLQRYTFDSMRSRRSGFHSSLHFRSAYADDWKRHFTLNVSAAFSACCSYCVSKYGYESDNTDIKYMPIIY